MTRPITAAPVAASWVGDHAAVRHASHWERLQCTDDQAPDAATPVDAGSGHPTRRDAARGRDVPHGKRRRLFRPVLGYSENGAAAGLFGAVVGVVLGRRRGPPPSMAPPASDETLNYGVEPETPLEVPADAPAEETA